MCYRPLTIMCATKFTQLTILLFFIVDNSDASIVKTCKIPGGDAGTCIPLNECDPLYAVHNKKSRITEEEMFYRQSVGSCGGGGHKIKVCCPPAWLWPNLVMTPVIFPEVPLPTADTKEVLQTVENSEQNITEAPSVSPTTPAASQSIIDQLPFWNQKIRCGVKPILESKIIGGGKKAEIDQYPWMALLEYDLKEFKCGGSLISRSHILTAAHCLYTTPTQVRLSEYNITSDPIDVVAAPDGGFDSLAVTIVKVQWILRHPGHLYGTSTNDIGLVRMKEKVEFGDFILPICLPSKDYRKTDFTASTFLHVAGWGGSDNLYVNSEITKSLFLPYVPIEQCRDTFVSKLSEENQLCAGAVVGVDSCRSDSGGPLMYDDFQTRQYVIVGIVSGGYTKCGTEGRPGVYTYVYKYVEWIKKNLEK